jgi:hypothetical protein
MNIKHLFTIKHGSWSLDRKARTSLDANEYTRLKGKLMGPLIGIKLDLLQKVLNNDMA